jgi:hypothetical protein
MDRIWFRMCWARMERDTKVSDVSPSHVYWEIMGRLPGFDVPLGKRLSQPFGKTSRH